MSLTNVKRIYYGVGYRPPHGNVLNIFDKLESICLDCTSSGKCERNILGDLNIDVSKRWDASVKQYLDRMVLKQLIKG